MKKLSLLRTLGLGAMLMMFGVVNAATITVTDQASFVSACSTAASGDVITLPAGDFDLTPVDASKTAGKSLSFIGNNKETTTLSYTSVNGEGSNCFRRSGFITIKNVKLVDLKQGGDDYLRGLTGTGGILFENCEIASAGGEWARNFSDGTSVTFKSCIFTVESSSYYSVSAYQGHSYLFEDCVFAGNAKGAIKLYRDQDKDATYNVTIKNCKFNKGSNTTKAPVYFYDNTGHGGAWNIFIEGENENVDGLYPTKDASHSWLYEMTHGSLAGEKNKSTIYVNGVCVYENGAFKSVVKNDIPNATQTKVDVEVTTAESAENVANDDIVAAIQAATENTAAVNTVAVPTIDGVTSTKNYLHIDLKAVEVAENKAVNAYAKKMTFDVKPIAATIDNGNLTTEVISNETLASAEASITFRLPVANYVTENVAVAYHNGTSLGQKDVQVDQNGNKYIEITTTSFSEFSYDLTGYKRTVTSHNEGTYGTICLPYASTNYYGMDLFEIADIAADGIYLRACSGQIQAGKPYIFKTYPNADLIEVEFDTESASVEAKSEGYLVGTYEVKDHLNNGKNYVLSNNALYSVAGENVTVGAYRAYIQWTGALAAARLNIILPGNNPIATGVEEAAAVKATKALVDGQIVIVRGAHNYNVSGVMLK